MFAKDKGSRINIQSVTAGSSLRGVGLAFTNLFLAYLFILFAIANAKSFLENPRLSVFLIVVTEMIVAIFLIIRGTTPAGPDNRIQSILLLRAPAPVHLQDDWNSICNECRNGRRSTDLFQHDEW